MPLDEKTYGQRLIEAAKEASELGRNRGRGTLLKMLPTENFDKVLISLLKKNETPAARMKRMLDSIEDAGSLEKFVKRWYSKDKIVCLPSSIKILPLR